MLVVPTAKILLFIALNVGPANTQEVYATSQSESYVLTPAKTGGWAVEAKAWPASDFTRDPAKCDTLANPTSSSVPAFLRPVAHHNWHHNTAMVFDNGDRVEKHGDHAFYIINAGGPNEKVFTIFYPEHTK